MTNNSKTDYSSDLKLWLTGGVYFAPLSLYLFEEKFELMLFSMSCLLFIFQCTHQVFI